MSEAELIQSDIATLFATDPLKLTKDDITAVIAYFRTNREKYLNQNVRAVKPTAAAKVKQSSKGPLPDIDLDLGDL